MQNLKISHITATRLAALIAGVKRGWPYRSGPALVDLFNACGFNDTYDEDFPGLQEYCADRLLKASATHRLAKVFELWLADEHWRDVICSNVIPECPHSFIKELNCLLTSDDIELQRTRGTYIATCVSRLDLSKVDMEHIRHDTEWMLELCVDLAWKGRLGESLSATKTLVGDLIKQIPSESTVGVELVNQLRFCLTNLRRLESKDDAFLRERLHLAHSRIRDLLHFLHQYHNVVSWR